jgi:hypothetical protein
MARPIATRSQKEWAKAQEQGLGRFMAIGALRRGIPMSVMVLLLLELFEGGSFDRARMLSGAFAERVLLVFAVFLAGGALSAFARWKSYEALYGDEDSST